MTLLETLVAPRAPLSTDDQGVVRVGGTRVRLETVLTAFSDGASPEQILLKYPSLNLTDIYGVIAYYLWHQREVDAYLTLRAHAIEESRQESEARFPPGGVRARLLARREERP